MKGKLFGIGVGPGDSELITLKALRMIKECDVIAMPGKNPQESVAYKIAEGAYAEIVKKETLPIVTPMTKDKTVLEQNYMEVVKRIEKILEDGKDVGLLTLGVPTVYSPYIYIHQKVVADGYAAEIINGITSFCAVAARLGDSLVEREELLHVIPSNYQFENTLNLPGTKVYMKAGSKLGELKEKLLENQCDAVMIEKCGMEDEKIYYSAEEMPQKGSYYSLVIVKDKSDD